MTSIESHDNYVVGIDIGGTKTLIALVNYSGTIVDQTEFRTLPENGAVDTMKRIHEAVSSLVSSIPQQGRLIGIGIVTAGVIDSKNRSIVYAANLGWDNVDVGSALEKSFQVPVLLGNDANLAAVAEYVWGTKKKVQDLIYITVSTGIGAGIVSGGKLVKGISDSAGEFGHITIDPFGPQCGCGNVGCLENYCSGTAIAAIANKELAPLPDRQWSSKDVLDAAGAGDEEATSLAKRAGFYLGNGIVSLIHLFNPSQIIMGGGVMSTDNIILQEAKRVMDERCISGMRKQVDIRRTNLGKEIGALGAAGLFYMD